MFLPGFRPSRALAKAHVSMIELEGLMTRKSLFGAVVFTAVLGVAAPAFADDWHGHGGWHGDDGWHGDHGHWQRPPYHDWHGHGWWDDRHVWHWYFGWGPGYGYYGPPPVYYAPPPVYYAPPPPPPPVWVVPAPSIVITP
jgi:hypothetical protein